MPEPVNVQLNVVGDARGAVRALEETTAAARHTEAQVQSLGASVTRAQQAWAAPNAATRVEGGLQSTGGPGRFGQLLAQGGIQDLLGQAGITLPGGASGITSALSGAGALGTAVVGAAGVAAIIAGAAKELNEAAKIADKLFGPTQGDPRQATSAAEVATDVRNAGRTSGLGGFLRTVTTPFTKGGLGLLGEKTADQQHRDAAHKMIDAMDPAELLTAIPLLSGDDREYAQAAYDQSVARSKYKAAYSKPVAAPTVVFNTAVLGSTQDAMAVIARAQRNNASQTVTAPRAP